MRGKANYAKRKAIKQSDINGVLVKTWPCGRIAAKELKISAGNISMVLKGERNSAGGYIWTYC